MTKEERKESNIAWDHNTIDDSSIHFFISYNSADRDWAEWLAWQLEEAAFTTVLQAWDFRPGSNFVLKMQEVSDKAERVIAVLSSNYLNALYTQPEWAAAFKRDPKGTHGVLLPVMVHDCKQELTGMWPQILYLHFGWSQGKKKSKSVIQAGIGIENNAVYELNLSLSLKTGATHSPRLQAGVSRS